MGKTAWIYDSDEGWIELARADSSGGGGGGSISEITSDDDSVIITDSTGPTTDLSAFTKYELLVINSFTLDAGASVNLSGGGSTPAFSHSLGDTLTSGGTEVLESGIYVVSVSILGFNLSGPGSKPYSDITVHGSTLGFSSSTFPMPTIGSGASFGGGTATVIGWLSSSDPLTAAVTNYDSITNSYQANLMIAKIGGTRAE